MRIDHWFLLLLVATPAVYTWWTGRAVRRAIDDPALPELLLARMRRIAQVTLVVIIVAAFMTAPVAFSIVVLLGVLAAHYPVRRAVYGDTWSFPQYLRFTSFSWIAFGGLWLFPFIASGIVVQVVEGWMPEPSARRTMLGLALGAVAAVLYLVWHRRFTRVWLALHQASPLEASIHAPLTPRFRAVLERAGARLPTHPSVFRYGVPGGQIVNAVALCALHERAVAMSDVLLDNLDADEATAVFAHEIAHHEHYTDALLRKRRVASIVLALLLTVVPALHLASGGRYSAAIDVVFLGAILAFFARGQQRHRVHETECDLRAVELTGDADAVIRGLAKIHALSRMPRRFSQEFERAATHPSLAHRIQAIRAGTSIAEPGPVADGPTVVATTTPGAYVALDEARSYWFEGVPAEAPLDVAVLREQAASYRALAYPELGELRLEAETPRMLRAVDLAGRSWSVGIRDEDVGRVQTALDRIDAKLGVAPVPRVASSDNTARTVAAVLLLATLMAGTFGVTTFVGFIAVFAPSATSLAAMAAMALGSVVVAIAAGEQMMPYEWVARAAGAAAALWAAWIAWRWYRATRDGRSREITTRSASRWSYALRIGLAIGVLTSVVGHAAGGVSSPAALLGDPGTASAAIAVLGSGAAMLAARRRAWRLTGAGLAALSVMGIAAGTIGDRWITRTTGIAWTTGRLSLVASVPVGRDVQGASLSPAGTRFLTQRYLDEDADESSYNVRIVTGSVSPGGPTHSFTAVDAVLPNERDVIVLSRSGDSLELRLERPDADSTARVAWSRALPPLLGAELRFDAHRARWIVHGRQRVEGASRFATVSGAIDGTDVRQTEVPVDTVRGQLVYSYGDGTSLLLGTSPRLDTDYARRSPVATYVAALRGDAIVWTLWRSDRDGTHAVKGLRGYPTCAASAEGDAAICVEQGRRMTRLWRAERNAFVDLGTLPRRYDRATVTDGGTVVASSYRGHAIAIVDAVHQRGVRTALPSGDYAYVREISGTDSLVVAMLGTGQGQKLAVYRVE